MSLFVKDILNELSKDKNYFKKLCSYLVYYSGDDKSEFEVAKKMGFKIIEAEDLEKVDEYIEKLVNSKYKTIFICRKILIITGNKKRFLGSQIAML